MFQMLIGKPIITRRMDIKATGNYKNKLKESAKNFERTNIENKCWKLSENQSEST